MENLRRDKYLKDISEGRWGDRVEILHSDLSKEMGREENGKSRDLSKGV
ncbi:hypothetical protein [Thiolapillus sp.]